MTNLGQGPSNILRWRWPSFAIMSMLHNSRHRVTLRNMGSLVKVVRKRDEAKGRPENQNITFSPPLNASWAALFEEECNIDLITLPPQQRLAHNAEKTKYCRYHQNYGHTTEGCLTLRDKIKDRGICQWVFELGQKAILVHYQQYFVGSDLEQNDPMVITTEVANFTIRKAAPPTSSTCRPLNAYRSRNSRYDHTTTNW
ncbi:hypothetical protein CR513_20414, partial [Mucuna pruriens]